MDVVKYPAPILRAKCRDIEDFSGEMIDFAEQMIKTMIDAHGIGLAGPQVGKKWNIFAVGLGDQRPMVFVNPLILQTSVETSPYEEGCLSFPGVYASVIRPKALEIQAWTPHGKKFKMEADGLLARVIQHEMDHLKGIMFFDHLGKNQQSRLLKEYHKRRKG